LKKSKQNIVGKGSFGHDWLQSYKESQMIDLFNDIFDPIDLLWNSLFV
jgi:hypothetical protein